MNMVVSIVLDQLQGDKPKLSIKIYYRLIILSLYLSERRIQEGTIKQRTV
jgi:hypothetical protein